MAELVIIAESILLAIVILLWLHQNRVIGKLETELDALRQTLAKVQGALE
jgi:hypothetical protein